MNISVIGGTGGMGKSFVQFFKECGFKVFAIGRNTKFITENLTSSDVIFISVPSHALNYAVGLLKPIPLKGKLIVSLGSCMKFDERVLKSLKGEKVYIHALFGPSVYPFVNQNFIIAGQKDDKNLKKIVGVLKKAKANISFQTTNEHDKNMAYVQALSQFSSILLAKTLSKSKSNPQAFHKISTATYRMNEDLIQRILSQKAELWSHIQFENQYFLAILDDHLRNMAKMKEYIVGKDYKGFEKMYTKTQNYWSNLKK